MSRIFKNLQFYFLIVHEKWLTNLNIICFAVLAVAQCFGLMPIHGIRNLHSLSFRWISVRVLISTLYMVLGIIVTYLYMNRLKKIGITAKNLGMTFRTYKIYHLVKIIDTNIRTIQVVDYSMHLVYFATYYLFNWLHDGRVWFKTGQRLKKSFWIIHIKRLEWNCPRKFEWLQPFSFASQSVRAIFIYEKVLLRHVLNLFVAEHTISVVQTVWNVTLKMEKCNWEIDDKWKHYFTSEFNYIFELLPYNLPLAILLLVINRSGPINLKH